MNLPKKIFIPLFISILFATSVFALESYETDDLSGKMYFEKIRKILENAEEEIFIVMYIIELKKENEEDLIYKLCEHLIKARKRCWK